MHLAVALLLTMIICASELRFETKLHALYPRCTQDFRRLCPTGRGSMDISAKDCHQGVCVAWSIRKMQALGQVSPHLNTQQRKDNPKVCFFTNARPFLVGALRREGLS